MRFIIITFLISSLFHGCVKEKNCGCAMPYQIYYLKAKVIQTSDISCGKPVLDFSEDSVRIRALTHLDDLFYSVVNLPTSFVVQDKKLYVSMAKLKTEEEFVCTAVGFWFPHLKVLDVKNRD